jgi:hypothetical protein
VGRDVEIENSGELRSSQIILSQDCTFVCPCRMDYYPSINHYFSCEFSLFNFDLQLIIVMKREKSPKELEKIILSLGWKQYSLTLHHFQSQHLSPLTPFSLIYIILKPTWFCIMLASYYLQYLFYFSSI